MILPIRYNESDIERILILTSVTVKVGDAVKLVTGGADISDAVTDPIYGAVVGIGNEAGVSLDNLVSGTDYDGTWTSSTQTYVATDSNLTSKKICVYVVPAEGQIFQATLSAARGTTAGSDLVGYYLSVLTTDAAKLGETTASTSTEQFIIVKNHETSTTETYVKVVEHQCYNVHA